MFTGINHVGIATSDVDRAVRVWWDRYAVGPWRVYTFRSEMIDARVDGEVAEFGMRVGMCSLNASTRIELIQPLDDRSPYARSLAERGGADHLHHLRLDVEDYADALGHLRSLELREILNGQFRGSRSAAASSAAYLHTGADLGFVVEVAELPSGSELPEPEYTYPSV